MGVPMEYLELARRAWAAFDACDDEAFAACMAPDWREYNGDSPVEGLAETFDLMQSQRRAFPDKHSEMLHLFGDVDLVTTRTLTIATHTGRYISISTRPVGPSGCTRSTSTGSSTGVSPRHGSP